MEAPRQRSNTSLESYELLVRRDDSVCHFHIHNYDGETFQLSGMDDSCSGGFASVPDLIYSHQQKPGQLKDEDGKPVELREPSEQVLLDPQRAP